MNQYDEAIQFCKQMIEIFAEIKPDEVEFAESIKTKLETIQNETNNDK